MSAASATTSQIVHREPTPDYAAELAVERRPLPAAADKLKKLELLSIYFELLRTAKWTQDNEALLDKYITPIQGVFATNPVTTFLAETDFEVLGPKVIKLWEEGLIKESGELITQFFSNAKNKKNACIFFFRWKYVDSNFLTHFLNCLPATLTELWGEPYVLHLTADEHVDIIAKRFPNFPKLDLANGVTAASAIKIAASMPKLQHLSFCGCTSMTKNGILAVASSTKMTHLKYLNLSHLKCVDDEFLVKLSKNPHFTSLDQLEIYGATVTATGLNAIATSKLLPKLRLICIGQVDQGVKKALASRNVQTH